MRGAGCRAASVKPSPSLARPTIASHQKKMKPSSPEAGAKITVADYVRTMANAIMTAERQSSYRTSAPPQPMLVLGAGFGRTGTMSLVAAYKRLGLRSYHMKDGLLDTPGHGDLWARWAHAHDAHSQMAIAEATEALIGNMSADGFNATADFPSCLITAALLEHYPSARVVLGVRQSGTAWADSVLSTIARVRGILQLPPWAWVPRVQGFLSVDAYIWSRIGAPVDPSIGTPRHAELAAAHDTWIADIKRTVPAESLLVHQARDGWAPLCTFLSPVDPSIRSACDEILASGEAYPHVNDTWLMRQFLMLLWVLTVALWLAPLALLLVCWRRRVWNPAGAAVVRSGAPNSKAKGKAKAHKVA